MQQLKEHRFAFALVLAALLHCLLFFASIELPQATKPTPSLQVRLNVDSIKPQRAIEQVDTLQPEVIPEPADRTITEKRNEAIPPASEKEGVEEPSEAASLNRDTIIANTKELLLETKPTFRNFSGNHFQVADQKLSTKRSNNLPMLLTVSTATSSQYFTGQATDLIQSANGESMCWQQRGIPGETQRWHRVPLALCGHLK